MVLIRFCPQCNKELSYKHQSSWIGANKKNARCKSCALSGSANPMYGKTGEANHFFGRKHSESLKEKLRLERRGKKLSIEHAKKVIAAGKKNLIQGSMYDFWLEKYGKEEADKRLAITKAKHSYNNSGSGNPMYGKPAPQGSGNGWSGWYRGWFFRSLRELKYVLELDEAKTPWKSAESSKYKVSYQTPMGFDATYFPDLVVNDTIVIECKPKRLWETPSVKAKTQAAKKHFAEIGMEYQLVDPGTFDDNRFTTLVQSGIIELTEKYKRLYEQRRAA